MGYKISKKTYSLDIQLENLKGYSKKYKALLEGKILERAARHLQETAFLIMQDRYFETKKNRIYYNKKYLAKPKTQKLEHLLFSKLPPLKKKDNNTVEIRLLNKDYDKLIKIAPHLQWQEEGHGFNVDDQPYEVRKKSLGPITKEKALTRERIPYSKRTKSKLKNSVGAVVYLKVPHKALPSRDFILVATRFWKKEGRKILLDKVREELKKIK